MSTNQRAHPLSVVIPVVALVVLAGVWGRSVPGVLTVLVAAVQVAVVFAAVMHAEAIAHRIGEPFGSLVLAVAVTVIEVALIVSLMFSEGDSAAPLARDTVFAAVMIACNGVVGLALVVNARRSQLVRFSEQGSNALLATVVSLAGLSLVMPSFTSSTSGPTFTGTQLAFAAVASVAVYGIFLFVQTVGHRWMFLAPDAVDGSDAGLRAGALRDVAARLVLLVTSLVAVVGLAKLLSPAIEQAVTRVGAPQSFVGVVIALIVLLPESIAAVRAAKRDRAQESINLALGSALASIGLTIPAIAVASIWIDTPIILGLGGKEIVFLVMTAIIGMLTFGSGQATVLQATHHLALFVAFLVLSFNP